MTVRVYKDDELIGYVMDVVGVVNNNKGEWVKIEQQIAPKRIATYVYHYPEFSKMIITEKDFTYKTIKGTYQKEK